MTSTERTSSATLGLTALSAFGDRTTGSIRKALTAYVMAGSAISVGKAWYNRASNEFAYTVAVPGDDDIYSDLHRWVLDRLPSRRQRALTARSERITAESSEHGPTRRDVRLYYDGTRSQTIHLDGHKVRVIVEQRADFRQASDMEDQFTSRWRGETQRIIFSVRTVAARDAVLAVLAELNEARAAIKEPRFFLGDNWGSWNRRRDLPLRELSTVVLHEGQKEALVEDLATFLRAEGAYNRLGLPWHRGYLFEGPPGTGKTSLAKALAVHFQLDTYYIPLAALPNDAALLRLLAGVDPRSVLLLEDIDIVHGAKVRDDSEPGVTLSGLLNALDGVMTPHGLVTIMTTNNKSVIDDALLRPGRVDTHEHLGFVDDYQLAGLAEVGIGRSVELPPLSTKLLAPAAVVDVLKRHLEDPDTAKAALRDLVEQG